MDFAVVSRALTKRFGDSVALDGVDLSVPVGQVFGFVGPNGAGKTTTIRLMLDLLRPSEGDLRVLDMHPQRDGVALRQRIGYLPGDLNLPARSTARTFLADQ
ncbi:MAG: ATP-binding cassette domain-containing protein, partial [Actinomycetota bacterium]